VESESIESGLNAGLGHLASAGWYRLHPTIPGALSTCKGGVFLSFAWHLTPVDSPILVLPQQCLGTFTRYDTDELIRSGMAAPILPGDVPS
jgi:hypothetical protein